MQDPVRTNPTRNLANPLSMRPERYPASYVMGTLVRVNHAGFPCKTQETRVAPNHQVTAGCVSWCGPGADKRRTHEKT